VLERFAGDAPPVRDGDLATIAVPLDFLGVNNYSRRIVRARPGRVAVDVPAPSAELTDMGWEVYPAGLYESLVRMHQEYGVESLYVTENGAAFADVRGHDGQIHDLERIAYLDGYLDAVENAIAERCSGAWLLRLVAARQLRMVARLFEAVRPRLRRLPDPRAHTEGQLLLVPRPDRCRSP
jgi:beta-glucosidase/6-phospho-beta-glucosidase/beta-galactosidase